VYGDFVGAGANNGSRGFERADTSSRTKRDRELFGDAANGFEEGGAIVAGGSDVEDDEFVGTLGVVAGGEFDRIAGIAQAFEVDPLDDAGTIGVEAGNNAMRQAHAVARKKFSRMRAPATPLFSG